jgi:hypothetical protein
MLISYIYTHTHTHTHTHIQLNMVVWPKHVANNLIKIVNTYWNRVVLHGNPWTWTLNLLLYIPVETGWQGERSLGMQYGVLLQAAVIPLNSLLLQMDYKYSYFWM